MNWGTIQNWDLKIMLDDQVGCSFDFKMLKSIF